MAKYEKNKEQFTKDALNNMSTKELRLKYGIGENTVYNWKKKLEIKNTRVVPKKQCEHCGKMISLSNYEKHIQAHLIEVENKSLTIKYKDYLIKGKYKCYNCDKSFDTALGLHRHFAYENGDIEIWNKGETKATNLSLKQQGETYSQRVKDGIIVPCNIMTEDTKQKISNSMKQAHKEGRAWNIGQSRWNNEPSYPEKFFMKVVENEFNDKNYMREYNVGRYSIDFAWVDKKLAIEIDGEQHYRFEEYQQRDIKKDELLKSLGWKVLRIRWKNMYKETKQYILQAKRFIDN